MTESNVKKLMSVIADKIPEEKYSYVKKKLATADDSVFDDVMSAGLHNPTHILLFSIFLGGSGVDRFIIGDIGLGIAKLLIGTFITCGIWNLIDIFFSYKSAKEKNVTKILNLL